MSDKDCPDKLEPEQHILTSVLKNVPIELMWHLREYQSRPSHYQIKWRARQPVEGKQYGRGGDLKFEYAQSADMYVRDRVLEEKYQHMLKDRNILLEKHRVLRSEYDDLLTDHMDGEEWKARHDDLLHQVQDVERGKDKEWTDDMTEQADKDYDAVTKGVISFINLLRR